MNIDFELIEGLLEDSILAFMAICIAALWYGIIDKAKRLGDSASDSDEE